ncbi:hypothetical protein ACH5RR_011628 [Cinchona calisaya]|uniref:BHLH domain-containing protein n=1 Tax=Cinchona calisaya TaxID=153742 RepID=A0ABD3A7Z5_9GENT
MELVKDHAPKNSTLCLIQPHHHPYNYEDREFVEAYRVEEGSSSEKSTGIAAAKNVAVTSPSSLSSPSSTHSDQAIKYQPEEGHSVINFRGGYNSNFANSATGGNGMSLLSFEQNDYSVWEDNLHYKYQNQQLHSSCTSNTTNPRMLENSNSSYTSTCNGVPFGWLSPEGNGNATINNSIQEDLATQETCLLSTKRPYTGESTQEFKKLCTSVTKTLKSKSTPTKDPQSVAAKNRRERISERLKILQDLVPNGSKVDLVTMLEKAISYVKFLQLQVKVLATDEFWPAQGAKAPDLSQVKEAIDAILSSQRDRNSSSSK